MTTKTDPWHTNDPQTYANLNAAGLYQYAVAVDGQIVEHLGTWPTHDGFILDGDLRDATRRARRNHGDSAVVVELDYPGTVGDRVTVDEHGGASLAHCPPVPPCTQRSLFAQGAT